MPKVKVQATVSVPEEAMLASLSEASGHSVSMIAARAVTEWLQHNYRDQIDLYSQVLIQEESTDD